MSKDTVFESNSDYYDACGYLNLSINQAWIDFDTYLKAKTLCHEIGKILKTSPLVKYDAAIMEDLIQFMEHRIKYFWRNECIESQVKSALSEHLKKSRNKRR